MQNKIDINIFIYKIFSGKYIIYETKNYGSIYDAYNNRFIFEGNIINGEKNGFGKEYENNSRNDLIFKGEYLNGKKNGICKKYYNNRFVVYEGEYLNGKIWNCLSGGKEKGVIYGIKYGKGFGHEYYDDNGRIKLEGEYLNGERNEKGKEFY